MQSLLQNFTDPVLSTSNPKDWFIHIRFYHAGKWQQRKFREGLNRISDLKNKKKAFDVLLKVRYEWLKAGWNPITDPKFKARKIITTSTLVNKNFIEAMDFALEKKKPDLAPKSYTDYDNVLEKIKATATDLGIGTLPVLMIERPMIMQILEKLFITRKMSNSRYNFYLVTIQAMFSKLETWTVVKYNPASKIEMKPVAESNKFKTYTDDEKIKIYNCLQSQHPPFLVYFLTFYDTGIRPKELLLLQVKDIDLKLRLISIAPDLTRQNSKTKNVRRVPITNTLYPFLQAMGLSNFPPDYYVFGSPFLPGKGNKGAKDGVLGSMRMDFLIPSPYHAKRNTITILWKKLIWNGLGIHRYLYAGKHTGADDKILAGIDLDALRNLYGHRSKYMTETYAKAITEVYNSVIREKAPSFTQAKVRRIA